MNVPDVPTSAQAPRTSFRSLVLLRRHVDAVRVRMVLYWNTCECGVFNVFGL